MSKSFLFITHLTPKAKRSVLRQNLIDIMKKSLFKQTYSNWIALWLGEEESEEDKIKIVDISNEGSLEKVYLRKDVISLIDNADYIVKLDDDDIIIPDTLERTLKIDFDCYCDRYHTFYDISSGWITQQKRKWIASTCIHKKEHAIKDLKNNTKDSDNFIHSLFYGEHGKDWINYYKNKKIVYAPRTNPVYIRVLSPTSITAGAKIFPVQKITDIDFNHYYSYLKEFGSWNYYTINSDIKYFEKELSSAWKNFIGSEQVPIKGISFKQKIKDRIKYFLDL